jgi:hypothetical protein
MRSGTPRTPAGQGRNARPAPTSCVQAGTLESPGGDEPAVIRKEEHPDGRCQKGPDQTRCRAHGPQNIRYGDPRRRTKHLDERRGDEDRRYPILSDEAGRCPILCDEAGRRSVDGYQDRRKAGRYPILGDEAGRREAGHRSVVVGETRRSQRIGDQASHQADRDPDEGRRRFDDGRRLKEDGRFETGRCVEDRGRR